MKFSVATAIGVSGGTGRQDESVVMAGALGLYELKPALALGPVGREIVDDDVDLFAQSGGDDLVHEVEELDAPAAPAVAGRELAGGDLEGGATVERDRNGCCHE
jgi:hypothetical protein